MNQIDQIGLEPLAPDPAVIDQSMSIEQQMQGIFEEEWPIGGYEGGCGLIGFLHLNLMVSGVSIEETQRVVSDRCIDDLVYSR